MTIVRLVLLALFLSSAEAQCSTYSKAKDCRDAGCTWLGAGVCADPPSPTTPAPAPPTPAPAPSSCSSFSKKNDCPSTCIWDGGLCQDLPTPAPTEMPTPPPSPQPTVSMAPSASPSESPSSGPSSSPSTSPPVGTPTAVVPYDLVQFHPVFAESNLQAPKSSPAAVYAGNFAGYSSEYFYVTEGQYMTLEITKDTSTGANRAELRHRIEWSNTESGVKSIQARMRFAAPSNIIQFTFLQIHNKDYPPYPSGPPLRVVWFDIRDGKTDWIWANIRTGLDPKTNVYIPIQPRPSDFFDVEVKVLDSNLTIAIDNVSVPEYTDRDISHLDPLSTMYFKAGAYVNSGTGPAIVDFDQLSFTVTGRSFP